MTTNDNTKQLLEMEKCLFNAKHHIGQLMNLYGVKLAA